MLAIHHRLMLVVLTLALASNGAASDRLVDYVPPSLLADATGTSDETTQRSSVTATNMLTNAARNRPVTAADRWEKFEAEFGVKQRLDSPVLGSLQEAKYRLDRATFTMQEMILSVEEALRFDYGLEDFGLPVAPSKSPRSTSGGQWWDAMQNVRFQSDVRLKIAAEPYVGVKLVLPLGD